MGMAKAKGVKVVIGKEELREVLDKLPDVE